MSHAVFKAAQQADYGISNTQPLRGGHFLNPVRMHVFNKKGAESAGSITALEDVINNLQQLIVEFIEEKRRYSGHSMELVRGRRKPKAPCLTPYRLNFIISQRACGLRIKISEDSVNSCFCKSFPFFRLVGGINKDSKIACMCFFNEFRHNGPVPEVH